MIKALVAIFTSKPTATNKPTKTRETYLEFVERLKDRKFDERLRKAKTLEIELSDEPSDFQF